MKSVGERLAYTRNTILSMNQKDFSKLLCISQGALSEIENNKGYSHIMYLDINRN